VTADTRTVIAALTGATREITSAEVSDKRGVPHEPGFYAWWVKAGALAGVPPCPHPREDRWDLLYVGIGPARSSSTQTLRTRVLGNHLGGNIGSSTFRLSLAALLLEKLELHPTQRGKKAHLAPPENHRISARQRENLRLTWAVHPQPWRIEGAVISTLGPPLNLTGNRRHPFHQTMSQARRELRARAADPR